MVATKLSILHGGDQDASCRIVGVLEQLAPGEPTKDRPLALILHGAMGHKDYLFQKKLTHRLPIDSFRFDFRGNHESGGEWNVGTIANDVEDIHVVARYLSKQYGYRIRLVVGHSRGSVAACKWVASGSEEARDVEMYANVAGRYRMELILGNMRINDLEKPSQSDQSSASAIRDRYKSKETPNPDGYHEWIVQVAGKTVVGKIYPGDLETFASWDNSYIKTSFPRGVDVITIHGLKDQTVPPYDSILYANAFNKPEGRTATSILHLIENADHNFTGHYEEVIETILEWIKQRESGELPRYAGIWKARL